MKAGKDETSVQLPATAVAAAQKPQHTGIR